MTKETGAALDRAVANAMGLKSVNNCEKWGTSMTAAYFEDHPTDPEKVILRKKPRVEDDDDIQVYQRPWVGLTDKEILKFQDIVPNTLSYDLIEFARAIEAKLKEKNNGFS